MSLDLSQMHALDHWPGTRYCRSLYGGTRNHLALAWEHKYSDTILWLPRRLFKCPRGKHQLLRSQSGAWCITCRFKRPLTGEEGEHMDEVTRSLERMRQALREERARRGEVAD